VRECSNDAIHFTVLRNQSQYAAQFSWRETDVPRTGNRLEPHFGGRPGPVHVNVRWLVRLGSFGLARSVDS
jgi:hypothetical protein